MEVKHEEGIDQGLVWHYGNPVAEARTINAGDGLSLLSNRDIVEVSGPDRLTWLNSITSQKLDDLAAGQATVALVLQPRGHIGHVLYGVDDGTRFLAWTEPGRAQALVEHLERMRFMARVEIVRRDDIRLVWAGHNVRFPADCPVRDSELGGQEVFVAKDADLPCPPNVGTWALDAARIAAGIPRIFVDTDHRTIPNEIGLVGTHLSKGCYPGQETVAHVHNLGRPPRRLVQLHLDGSEAALPGLHAEVTNGEKAVGFVGASALHHELGPIALALVKRNVPVDATLVADGISASQEVLVDPDVGLHIRPSLG